MTKEIGGFIELELNGKSFYHRNGVLLNSARNALRYIIRTYDINRLHVPYYTCPVVWRAIEMENCEIIPYEIDCNFMPLESFDKNDFILYTNYFGVCLKKVKKLAKFYPNLIVDNAQAFYSKNYGLASIYSPRKFFGLPDGGIVLSKKYLDCNFPQDVSYQRCSHLIKRIDCGANLSYEEFNKNDESLNDEPIKKMSILTSKLLSSCNYNFVKNKRVNNFKYLAKNLSAINLLKLDLSKEDVPMYYPLLLNVGGGARIRSVLLNDKIYCPQPWREMLTLIKEEEGKNEKYFHENLIPLIIDQRYGETDLKEIVRIIKENI